MKSRRKGMPGKRVGGEERAVVKRVFRDRRGIPSQEPKILARLIRKSKNVKPSKGWGPAL